ncbi:MAG: carboxymuconolactone decarboxylase family protein [Methanobacteriota archaeon]|nr:MAG: carboxymuconolactone decarboxylase family protein [Euryarchaeota archaeon]
MKNLEDFKAYRQRMNKRILESGSLGIKRFFTLDSQAYKEGALPPKVKELLGLVASMVLRCDDCITYHIIQSVIEGATDEELWETFNIALIVGGSIVIPHLRRAVETLDQCRELADEENLSLD